MALSNAELACVYAALILVDDEVAITVSIHNATCCVSFSRSSKRNQFWCFSCKHNLKVRDRQIPPICCHKADRNFLSLVRVRNSQPSWKPPTLRSSHTGQASSPRPLKVLMSRTWSQTSDQAPELPQLPLPPHQLLPVIYCNQMHPTLLAHPFIFILAAAGATKKEEKKEESEAEGSDDDMGFGLFD